jgi:transcriptional regulator with XRE-family HTH domain
LPVILTVWYRYCTVRARFDHPPPDPESPVGNPAERRFESMRLALADRRRALGMSMSTLARQVGISPSMVSQIERGQSLPSVATLFALVSALGADVDAFFSTSGDGAGETPAAADGRRRPWTKAEAREALYVVRRDGRASMDIRGGVRWERLTPNALGSLELLELVYEPHAQSGPELYRHPGNEMMLVLDGTFEVHIGFEQYVLDAGDSIYFPSSLPHRYVNPTDAVVRGVTVIVRDVTTDARAEPRP